jgi:NAD(P)-dependent dehydrogenase (short-subunit alcohol dehydrogenase family)
VELRGGSALITGAALRVGRTLAEGLAREGMRVVVHYHGSAEAGREVVARIRAGGGEAVGVRGDLSRMADLQRVASEAAAAFGGLDVLVNNASVFPTERLEETDEALWDHTLAVNLKAPFFLIRELAPVMRGSKGAVVVNLADLAGVQSWAGHAAHGIAKAGLLHLTRVAARELAPEIRVNAIAPGSVLPPQDMPAEQVERLRRRTPLQRIGSPDDVLQALLYLLRADFVTGEVLVVDGGRLLR